MLWSRWSIFGLFIAAAAWSLTVPAASAGSRLPAWAGAYSTQDFSNDLNAMGAGVLQQWRQQDALMATCERGDDEACHRLDRAIGEMERDVRGRATINGILDGYNRQEAETSDHRRRELCRLNLVDC